MGNFLADFRLGILTFGYAFNFIWKNKLWAFIIMPGIMSIFLFAGMMAFAWQFHPKVVAYVHDFVVTNEDMDPLLHVAADIVRNTIWLTVFLLYLFVYKYLVMIFMSPMLAYISEKTEQIQINKFTEGSSRSFWQEIQRGVTFTMRNMVIESIFFFMFFIVGLIPFIGILSPFLIFTIQGYFVGFSMLDYNKERQGLSATQSIQYVQKHKGLAIANGMGFGFLLLIPVIGLLLAPTLSVVAATIAVIESESN